MPWWINFIGGIVVGLLAGTVVVLDVLYRPKGRYQSAWSQGWDEGYDSAKKNYSDWNLGWNQGYDSGVEAAMTVLGKYAKDFKDTNKPTEAEDGTSGKEESTKG